MFEGVGGVQEQEQEQGKSKSTSKSKEREQEQEQEQQRVRRRDRILFCCHLFPCAEMQIRTYGRTYANTCSHPYMVRVHTNHIHTQIHVHTCASLLKRVVTTCSLHILELAHSPRENPMGTSLPSKTQPGFKLCNAKASVNPFEAYSPPHFK